MKYFIIYCAPQRTLDLLYLAFVCVCVCVIVFIFDIPLITPFTLIAIGLTFYNYLKLLSVVMSIKYPTKLMCMCMCMCARGKRRGGNKWGKSEKGKKKRGGGGVLGWKEYNLLDDSQRWSIFFFFFFFFFSDSVPNFGHYCLVP